MSFFASRPNRIAFFVLALAAVLLPAAAMAQYDIYPVAPPCRAYDSRGQDAERTVPTGPLDAGVTYTVKLSDLCGLPPSADGVAISVAVIGAADPGDLSVFPAGGAPLLFSPQVNALPFPGDGGNGKPQNRAKDFLVAFGPDGDISFRADVSNSGKYHVKIDITGYFTNTVVMDDAATVAEDAAATPVDVLANDSDPDDALLIASVPTPPVNGTVVLTGGTPGAHTGLTYQPNPDYCNNPPGTTLDTFTYALTLGMSATVSMTVNCENDAPTDIALDSTDVQEGQPPGTPVGNFTTTDVDAGDTFTYTLVTGTGDTDNASFQIVGNQLQTAAVLDLETQATYSIRVRSTDAGGLFFEKVFTITLGDTNDAPTDITLSPSSVPENQPVGTTVGTFSTTDPDAGDTHTYTLVTGVGDTDNGSFAIVGNQLQTTAIFDLETKSSYSIRVRSTDAGSLFFEKVFTITVTNANEGPTDIALSGSTVAEGQPAGTAIGTFSTTDVDAGDTFTYTLVAGVGSTDNASFQIVGNQLQTAAVLDFETKPSYSIRVRSTDSGGLFFEKVFTITATNANEAPTDIALSPSSVAEGQPSGTAVGTFSTTDQDVGDTFTYTLVAGAGSTDNGSFTIVGNQLQTTAVFDFETKSSYSIRVRSTDSGGLFFEKIFTVSVTNANEGPTDIALSPSSVNENQVSGTPVGTFSTTDQDAGDTFTYTLVAGAGSTDNGSFTIAGSQLLTAAMFDFETKSSYSIRVRSTDAGGLFFEKAFTVTVNNLNEGPTDIALSNATLAENQASGTAVGNFSTTDPDVGDTFTYTLVAGAGSTDNGSFTIVGNQLRTAAVLDFETKSSYSIRVRSTDSGGLFFEKVFTITLTNVNEQPTDIALSNATVAEAQAAGTAVGNFSTTDPDVGDTFVYTLVAGVGSTDNGSFTIVGNQLQTALVFDFETKSSYSIRVRSTDSGGLFFEKVFTITVTNVNEAPTDIALSNATVAENQAAGTAVGNFSTTDPDVGDTFTYTLAAGVGSTDNGSFTIVGNQLRTAAMFDFETKSSYSIRVRSTDSGGLFFEKVFTITVTNLNEAPTDIALSPSAVDENMPSGTAVGTFSTSDPDAGDTFTYTLVAGAGSTDNGSFTIVGNQLRTAAMFDFETKSSYSIRVRSTDSGGLFFEKAFTVAVNNVPEAPVAGPDGFDSVSNTFLEVDGTSDEAEPKVYFNGTLLTNDFDPDGPTTLTAALNSASPGAVVTVNGDGTFTYLPPAGKTGTDTFTYTVSDGVLTSAPGTVTITFKHRVWYVKNDHPDGGLGRSTDPFDTLVEAETASAANDTIYVFRGDGTVAKQNNGITLKNGQRLIGQGVALTVPVSLNGGPASTQLKVVGTHPLIHNNTDDAGEDNGVVVSATAASLTGIEIRGLSIQGRDNAIDVTATGANNAGVTIQDNLIASDPTTGLEGIDVNANSTGTVTLAVDNNTLVARGNAIDIARTNGTMFITGFANNVVSGNTTGSGIVVTGPAIFDSNTSTGALDVVQGGSTVIGQSGNGVSGGGLVLSSVSGNLHFTDLDIYSDGAAGGLSVTGTGAFTGATGTQIAVDSAAGTFDSNGGPAVSINNASVSLPLGFLRSLNSTTTGISLVNAFGGVGSTALSVSNGQITDPSPGASGTAVNISGGNGNITIDIPITNNSGNAVAITGRTSDTVSFPKAIAETGSGISLTTNTGATINFTGAITASTGANAAFTATGGGTITATDTTSTLTTTTGTALNVANTTIGAAGLKFRSISSNGASSGIVLSSTGSSGGLTVAGNGGTCTIATPTCTGGTIQGSSGAGINLTSTAAPSLSLMRVTGGGDDGIRGSSVTGFTLANSLVTNNGNALGEHGLDFSGLTGSASITNSVISGSFNSNASIRNSSGTLTLLAVTGSTFSNNVSTSDGDGLLFEASATANMSINVSNSTFSAHQGDHFQAAALNSGILNIVFSNNTLSGGHAAPLGQGITINAATGVPGYSGSVTYDLNGNTINGAISNAIMVNLGTSAAGSTFAGQIRNNIIGTSGSALSCSTQANGINVEAHGNGTHTVSVTGNTIRRCFDRGISILANDGNGVLNLTATNNTVTEMSDTNGVTGTPREAFILQAGSTTTNVFGQVDSHSVCMNLSGPSGSLIGGAFKNGDIRTRQRFRTSVRMPGYAGSPFDTAAVIAFLQGNNPGTTATATAQDDAGVTTDGYFGGAACPLP
ncbi:MAG: cadherin domain-containing protein [Acidobacteriota bacterium]